MDSMNNENNGGETVEAVPEEKAGLFASKRWIVIILVTLLLLWLVWMILGFLGGNKPRPAKTIHPEPTTSSESQVPVPEVKVPSHVARNTAKTGDQNKAHTTEKHADALLPKAVSPVIDTGKGIAFVTACMQPMDYELNGRFWGWRPNDILNFTDNVNNFQLGVLEVTRRTSVALAEYLSRTGSTDAYVPNLESAMNDFMINPRQYWFPTAESKYQEGLDEMKNYIKMLKTGDARFYKRVDNLVPMFRAFESMLGSCDENLVKNQGDLSTFKADNYFYYSKGVASAMGTILEAASEDFADLIASIQGTDVLHHAITALDLAAHMDPWIVFEGAPDGILSNHRSNMAAQISHARFYVGVLNTALTGNIQ